MVWCSTAGIYALLERKLHDRQGDYMNKGNNTYQRLYPSHTRWYYRSFIAFLPTCHLVILMFFLLSITMPHIGWLASCAASLFYDDIGPSQGNRTFTSCCQGDSDSLEYVWKTLLDACWMAHTACYEIVWTADVCWQTSHCHGYVVTKAPWSV